MADSIAISAAVSLFLELLTRGIDKVLSNDTVASAIQTVDSEFLDIEGLPTKLGELVKHEQTAETLERMLSAEPQLGLEKLAKVLVDELDFYCPPDSYKKAEEILGSFFSTLNDEILKSREGNVYQSSRIEHKLDSLAIPVEELRDSYRGMGETLTTISDNVSSLISIGDEKHLEEAISNAYEHRVDDAKELIEKGKHQTAKDMYLRILDDLKTEDNRFPRVHFRVLTNLASCELELGDKEAAADYMIAAYHILPNEKKAKTNMAIAMMLRGRPSEGIPHIDEVLESDPSDIEALSNKASIYISMERYDEAEGLFVGLDVESSAYSCYQLGYIQQSRGDYENARKYFKLASDIDPDSIDYLSWLSISIINPIIEKNRVQGFLKDQEEEDLKQADALLSREITLLKQRETSEKLENTLINRAVVRTLLSNHHGAIRDCEECLQINPSNSLAYRRMGFARIFEGDYEEALQDLSKAIELGETASEVIPMIKDIIVSKNQGASEAIALLTNYVSEDSKINSENYSLYIALIEAYIDEGRTDIAKSMLDRIKDDFGNDTRYILTLAKLEDARGDKRKFEELLLDAYRSSSEKDIIALYLADFYYKEERYDEAIPFYEQFIEPTVIGSILTRYLICLYYSEDRAQNYEKCLEIGRAIREQYGITQVVTEIEASIYDELGDLNKASVLYKELSEKFPDEYKHKYNHAMSEFRLGNEGAAISLIDSINIESIDNPVALLRVAYLLNKFERKREAIEQAYRALELAPMDSLMHLSYIHLFTSCEMDLMEDLEPGSVKSGAYVTLQSDSGTSEYLITEKDEKECGPHELSIGTGLGSKLQGKTVGDRIAIGEVPSEETIEIVDIKSKYVKKFQDSIANYGILFGDKGVQKFTVGEDLREIFDQMDRLEEETRSSVNLYIENQITLHILAKLLGKTIFDIWLGLLQDPNLKIRCAKGDYDERSIEDTKLKDANEICVDLIGLLTLAEIGMLDILPALFQKIYIHQSARDELEEILFREGAKREHMVIGKEGGQYVRFEVTEESLKKKKEFLEKIHNFIRTSCALLPLEKPYSQKEKRLAEIIGVSATDLMTPKRDNMPIYTDDRNLRELAFNENGIEGIGIQSLLRKALEKGIISNDIYQEKIILLIRLGYGYISIDAKTLIYAVRAVNGHVNSDFEVLLNIISSENTEMNSAIIVSAEFIKAAPHKNLWVVSGIGRSPITW